MGKMRTLKTITSEQMIQIANPSNPESPFCVSVSDLFASPDVSSLIDGFIDDYYSYTEVALTAAQIKTFFSDPPTLLPALTAGNYYSDVKIAIELAAGNVGFDTADKSLYVFWGTSYMPIMAVSTGFIYDTSKNLVAESSSPVWHDALIPEVSVGYQNATTPEALKIGTWGADSTVGNGTMLVKVWYKTKAIGTEL